MDVVYEGPLQLGEAQVQQLLGYQATLNKHINWDKTRSQVGKSVNDCIASALPSS
jgi:hypothetical protein